MATILQFFWVFDVLNCKFNKIKVEPAVNFIIILRTIFFVRTLYEKFIRKMLMKLTPEHFHWYSEHPRLYCGLQ